MCALLAAALRRAFFFAGSLRGVAALARGLVFVSLRLGLSYSL